MDIRVLGQLRVAGDDRLGPTQRRLVALLAAREGEVVSTDRIAEVLGGVTRSAVRTAVSRARLALPDVIAAEPPGYVVHAGSTDAARFEELASAVRAAASGAEAVSLADDALSLWYGEAFAEFAHEPWVIGRATALNELRWQVAEERAGHLLVAGRVDDAVAAAEWLVGEQPLRERGWSLLMRGLAGQGRRTDALRAFQAYRTHLSSVGTEPSAALCELDADIASGRVDATAGAVPSRPTWRDGAPERPPSGVVAFLFTDIEGSTGWWARDPGGMSSSLELHDELVRATVHRHGGYVFAAGGDGFGVAFDEVSAATAAAIELRDALEGVDWGAGPALRVRMGLHLGEAECRAGDYFGTTVNLAARVGAAGHGGQVLVTDLVRAAVDVDVRSLGEFRLRGLDRPVGIHQLGGTEFPPLRVEPVRRTNVPTPLTSTVGRAQLIVDIGERLTSARVVSLVGGGGHGKTRTALEVARRAEDADGVWFVDLSPVDRADAVVEAVATTLGVQRQPDLTGSEAIVDWLRGRELLLVVDNCEQVLPAAAALAAAIVSSTDSVTLLVTSREPLRIPGEVVVAVPPLDVADAVDLFLARSEDAGSDPIEEDERGVVESICRRLDGIPLAVELAAARTRALTPGEILSRLDDRLQLLHSGADDAGRHRTLRAAIDWSYELLGEAERIALARASVFARDFDLAAVETVLADADLGPAAAVDATLALVDRSLLVRERRGRVTRFRLLETVRLYAGERLRARGEHELVTRRMVDHLTTTAERARSSWLGPGQPEVDELFDAEWDNLRAALSWSIGAGDVATARRIVLATNPTAFCRLRHEHAGWAAEVLRRSPRDVDVLGVATRWAWASLEHDRLVEFANRAVDAAGHDGGGAAVARSFLILLRLVSGRTDDAAAMFPVLRREIEILDDPYDRVVAMFPLALAKFADAGDPGSDALSQMLAEAELIGAPSLRAAASFFAASALLSEADVDMSALDAHLELATAQARVAGDRVWEVQALNAAAHAAVSTERDDALERCRIVLARAYDTRFWVVAGQAAQVALAALEASGRVEAAATIAGGLEHHFPVMHPAAREICDHYAAEARRHPRSGAWMARGGAMSRERLVRYVIAELDRAIEASSCGSPPS